MDLELKDRVALITGTSIGIGRATAKTLAAEGVKLVMVARRGDLMKTLEDEIVADGGHRPLSIVQDVTAPDAHTVIRDKTLSAYGHIDILVNNAGGSRPLPVDAPESAWEEAIALNFTSVRRLTHAFLPTMSERKWGRIINITGKSEPDHVNGAFCAKAGIHSWAKG